MKLLVVESPSKAKTILKYLGKDFNVLASFGHVRDLVSKNGSVDPNNNFSFLWEISGDAQKKINAIAKAAQKATILYLATDPDREGEAIAWHIVDILKQSMPNLTYQRVVFNEVTQKAVNEAIKNPRDISYPLVDAYLARRALDYLVGFHLSPVLWRKLPGSKSAGRVQSVALKIITDRELEIESFKSREYWSVKIQCINPRKQALPCNLVMFDGNKLEKFSIDNQKQAEAIKEVILNTKFHVQAIENKEIKRNPKPPFTTSTLQQDASRKLGFNVKKTMQVAQSLYEGIDVGNETKGLITYMRTDSVAMSKDAIEELKAAIVDVFGNKYVTKTTRSYKTKTKNAQEAHECIRPTDFTLFPHAISDKLTNDQFKLYDLVWRRAVASQMSSALFDQVIVSICNDNQQIGLRSVGTVMKFNGFLKAYEDDSEEQQDDEGDDKMLPESFVGDQLDPCEVDAKQHFTEPPPRYTEAGLVKKMEELGIGRPSTYANIIYVIQKRNYVKIENKKFIPEERGMVVTSFLDSYFNRYVQYDFTAKLEEQLDDVSNGSLDWTILLRRFWDQFIKEIDGASVLKISDVLSMIEDKLSNHFFKGQNEDARLCKACNQGTLKIKLGKAGVFIGCSKYPDCTYVSSISNIDNPDALQGKSVDAICTDANGTPVFLKLGRYGYYLEAAGEDLIKRKSLPKFINPEDVNPEIALKLLSLPRIVGEFDGANIEALYRGFGPYLHYNNKYYRLSDNNLVFTIDLQQAIEIIKAKK